ncbi:hypothetical protein HYX13_03665 [Candidatus Woesearchaeota archaeon]|nr:hypothetical protein [Candidatus Woesearchaeota archaeon]
MLIRNLPFSLDAHLQSPFDPTADLCEIEVLKNAAYLREMKAPQNSLRAKVKKSSQPTVEYLFTLVKGLDSVSHVERGGMKKEILPLTRERAERAYHLLETLIDYLTPSQKSVRENKDDELHEMLINLGYIWDEEQITKSVDYDERKMLSALKHLQNGRGSYFAQQQFVDITQLQKALPMPDSYHKEDLYDGSTLYRTNEKINGRYFITEIVVKPVLLDSRHKGWHLHASTSLEERSVPLATGEEYCLHLSDLEKDMVAMVTRLGFICQKYLMKGDIRTRAEKKLG